MAYEENVQNVSLPAAGDLSASQYRVVDVNSSGQAAVVATAGAKGVGILQNKPNAAGVVGAVAINGVSKVVLGGTVAAGAEVVSDNAGRAVAVSATNTYVIGTLIVGGAVNQIGSVLLKPYRHTVSA